MQWSVIGRLAVVILIGLQAGWMTYDAAQSFVTGDYITPESGEYAGQLGPWAALVEAIGIAPRSVGMRVFFIAFGVIGLATAAAFLARLRWAWHGLVAYAALSLWYLVIGTVLSLAALVLLFVPGVRRPGRLPGDDAKTDDAASL